MKRIQTKTMLLSIVPVLVAVILGWSALPGRLPDPATSQRFSLKLQDRNGIELRDIPSASGERGSYLSLEQIPEQLREAFIQAEDRRFYSHHGVDWRALARAFMQNLHAGTRVSGASTITMQSARLAFDIDHSYPGKVWQGLTALKMESHQAKGRILEYYLNHVPFSRTVIGVAQACEYYFASDCQRISIAQAATLAVLVRAPNRLWQDKASLTQKRNALLHRMAGVGDISEESGRLAMAETIPDNIRWANFQAPHFTEKVRVEYAGLDSGILQTSLDIGLQRDVQALVKHHVKALAGHKVNAAAVLVVDNATGEVLAYVGSPDYFDETNHGKVDYIQTRRQPGSSVKPFTYALAMQQGYTLATLLPDLPMVFSTQAGPYRPRNYDGTFSGPRRLREALANSLNVPALYTAIEVGNEPLLQWFHHMGFEHLDQDAEYYGPGLTLGNGEVSLWELVRAYVALAREGNAIPLSTISTDRKTTPGQQLMDKRIAYLLGDALRDPLAREAEFGRHGPLNFSFPVAAKTGTSSDFRDNWVVGYSGELTVGVWVGNEQGTPLWNVSGVTGAGPLFHQVMVRAMQSRSRRWIPRPDGLVEKSVCPLSGMLATDLCEGQYTELFRAEHVPQQPDTFYRQVMAHDCYGEDRVLTYVQLPALYREWENSFNLPTLKHAVKTACGESAVTLAFNNEHREHTTTLAQILEPRDGSFFARDPHIPESNQKMAIRLMVPDTAVKTEVQINDQPAEVEAMSDTVYLWAMSKGEQKLKARFQLADGRTVETEDVRIKVF